MVLASAASAAREVVPHRWKNCTIVNQRYEQLAKNTATLVHELEERKFQDEWLIDRIDRILDLQQRLERYESSVDGAGRDSAADHND